MKLSEHFTLQELSTTSTGLPNVPTAAHQAALTVLATTILEPIRARFGPVVVHSGYRSPAVNAKIGGSATSQHSKGEACDFHVPGHALDEVFRWIVTESGLPFGQVILEGRRPDQPTWIHVSLGEPYRPAARCRMALVFDGAAYSAWKG